jgi:hypothetical protein
MVIYTASCMQNFLGDGDPLLMCKNHVLPAVYHLSLLPLLILFRLDECYYLMVLPIQ